MMQRRKAVGDLVRQLDMAEVCLEGSLSFSLLFTLITLDTSFYGLFTYYFPRFSLFFPLSVLSFSF